jgi:myo-inositol 2-dehydrogenase/D-chiro-inositol 1-dehydrogenase
MGIVGLGKMGDIRANSIRKRDDTVLVSGTDPTPPKRGFDDLQILENYEAVINSDVDAIFVCAPNRYIPDVVVAAMDAGKHVFCENRQDETWMTLIGSWRRSNATRSKC